MHFIAPQDNESGCTWRNEYTATDANHDGHPEYVHGRMLGTCVVDADHNGVPEAGLTIARDFQVWDNDSDGTFNALEADKASKPSRTRTRTASASTRPRPPGR